MNNFQSKTNTLPAKLKAERPMPKWVTETTDRIGPKPPAPPPATTNGTATPRPPALPPKKNQAEPDYEVIEFSGQQYSNEPNIGMRPKTPDTRRPESALKCTLCGSNNPWVTCAECAQQIFCASCDDMFHKHPKRKTHLRKAIEMPKGMPPVIPPKAVANQPPPVAPPRRNKRGMPSPMPLRRDQVLGSTVSMASLSPVPGQQQAWHDRLGSLKRGLTLSNRPLPETPKTPTSDGVSSRSTTPNSKSVFDSIQKPPSITLEKIKNKASATLDRMALLQQRYRQHKQGKSIDRMGNPRDQTFPSDQWSNISSPTHFRSGSMSSGINSAFDYPDDSSLNFPQHTGMRSGLNTRNMSSSVFNLNQMSQRPLDQHPSRMWMGNSQMQQAQSMAHLNCLNCSSQPSWNQPHHPEDWPGAANANLNRSNMSLNMPPGFYPGSHPHGMMHPPPVFMNMPGMYPYPVGVGMPPMNQGIQQSTRSRVASRASSRLPSPTLSRKSMQIRKKRSNYAENELTDDEDSDNDDRRSLMSQRSGMTGQRRGRRISSASQAILDEEEEPRTLRSKILSTRRDDRRGPSIPKSVQSEWTPQRRTSTTTNSHQNFSSYKKVYSDSPISPDSEASETPSARALVQAKIQEKLKATTETKPKAPIAVAMEVDVDQSDVPQHPSEAEADEDEAKPTEEVEETAKEDSPTLGPPPSTPEHEWECEFCTFVNEAKTKICSICCKTPKSIPMQPKPVKVTTKDIASTTNGISKLKISQSGEDSEDHTGTKKKDDSPVEDIWATLDESIKAETTKAKRNAENNTNASNKPKTPNRKSESPRAASVSKEKKVEKISTGCGPSPPKEVSTKIRSTATSPVPQSISTQTYDVLPIRKDNETPSAGTSTEIPINEIQDQSYTPPTRNFSPRNVFTPLHADATSAREAEHLANLERNLRFYRDMSVTAGDRYRSSNDIRLDELPSPMSHSRPQPPPFGAEYLPMQKAQMYHNDNFFDQYAASKRNEPTRDPEIELFMMLKEAEHYKFTPEELHAALKHCGDAHPIIWLRENWPKLVQTVQSLATKYGQERIENVIGTISTIEAREALRMHGGNVWQAITECVEQRQRKYLEISAKGNYSREDIVTALTAHHGNVDLAILDLSKTQLKPFLMRVWGSPGGVENDSANYMPTPPKTEVSSPIHEFLSANADQLPFTQDQANFKHASVGSNLYPHFNDGRDEMAASQNRNVLKDLEILIGNMEQVQAKQSGHMYRSMEDILGNLLVKRPTDAEMDVDSERIFMKSPILSHRPVAPSASNSTDIKNFVWQHIQDVVPNLVEQVEKELLESQAQEEQHIVDVVPIMVEQVEKELLEFHAQEEQHIKDAVPNLVEQVEKELLEFQAREEQHIQDVVPNIVEQVEIELLESQTQEEPERPEEPPQPPQPPPIDAGEFIMEEVIKPLIKYASLEEEPQVEIEEFSPLPNFGATKDRALGRRQNNDDQFNSFSRARKAVFIMGFAPFSSDEGSSEQESSEEESSAESQEAEKAINVVENEIPAKEVNVTEDGLKNEGVMANEIPNQQNDDEPEDGDKNSNENAPKEQKYRGFTLKIGFNRPRSRLPARRRLSKKEKEFIVNESFDYSSDKPSTSGKGSKGTREELNQLETSPSEVEKEKVVPNKSNIELESEKPTTSKSTKLPKPSSSRPTKLPTSNQVKQPNESVNAPIPVTENVQSITNQGQDQLEPPKTETKIPQNKIKKSKRPKTKDVPNPVLEGPATDSKSNVIQEPLKAVEDPIKTETIAEVVQNVVKVEQQESGIPVEQTKSTEDKQQPQKTKQVSRIPVRRTTSSTSLKSTPLLAEIKSSAPSAEQPSTADQNDTTAEISNDEEVYEDIQASSDEEPDFYNTVEEITEAYTPTPSATIAPEENENEEDTSDQELFSVESDDDNVSQVPSGLREEIQSPTSESEVFLIIGNEQSSSLTPSTSTSTMTPTPNKSIDFKYDSSKQNLSELVEDTQRLIKQMKDEIDISMESFDSEDDYSEDYSYEEYEEEYEEEEDEIDEGDEEEEEEEEEEISENEEVVDAEEEYEEEVIDNEETASTELEESDKSQREEEEIASTGFESDKSQERENISEDDIEYIDIEDETPTRDIPEASQPTTTATELPQVAINHSQSTIHSPSNAIDSSNLTNSADHSATDDDIHVSVFPDPRPSGPETYTSTDEKHARNTTVESGEPRKEEESVRQEPTPSQVQIELPQQEEAADREGTTDISGNRIETGASTMQLAENTPTSSVEEKATGSQEKVQQKKGVSGENKSESVVPPKETPTAIVVVKKSETENAARKVSKSVPSKTREFSKKTSVVGTEPVVKEPTPSVNKPEEDAAPPKAAQSSEEISNEPTPTTSKATAEAEVKRETPQDNAVATESQPKSTGNKSEKTPSTTSQKNIITSSESIPSSLEDHSSPQNVPEEPSNSSVLKLLKEINNVLENSVSAMDSVQTTKKSPTPTADATFIKEETLVQASPPDSTAKVIPNTFPNKEDVRPAPKPTKESEPLAQDQNENDNIPSTSKSSMQQKSPSKKPASKIPKPNGGAQPKSVPTRSKSFSAPSPIGISSVRAIQQELFNKQSQLAKPATAVQRLVPPTVVRKKSISEAISKFTQVTAEHAVQRSRTQPKIPKIPKKKYHETCFSDEEYQDSTSEEETPATVAIRMRKHSAPVFRTYANVQEALIENPEVLAKRIIDEGLLGNMAEAQLAAALVGMKFPQDVSIWAAKECCDLEQAISLLQQDCELCMGSYPLNQIVSMLKCTHKCCKQCAKNYFTIQITDRSINDCNCPFCKIPELQDPSIHEDESLEYFSNLDIFLKNIIEPEVHELFQRKLRDRTLVQDPNFKWCIQCSSGFFARPKQKRLICPDCGSVTCSQCRKTWEKQHEGISCEKFQEWKEANDPEIQAKGVADHLAINGIDCPKCHFKYSLARGGCMHFTCTQCKFEFCYGCSKPFRMGAKCTVSPYCSKLGLHSHHPRSCLFYLRDKEPHQLQNLLIQNDVPFDVDPTESDEIKSTSKCPIPLQKETPKGLVDAVCNADVQPKHAGLCRQHYVEYLAGKVSKAGIDPLPILDLTDCVQELRRRGLALPERGPWDTDEIYRNMCSDIIKEKIPID